MPISLFAAALAMADRPQLSRDPAYFPIAVWLQSPANAKRYQEIGINLYVGLWQGPTEAQIAALRAAKMPVICDMNEWARSHLGESTIVGWMHGDEPDNAQALPDGKGWGPPVPPSKIVADFAEIRRRDPKRPVFLNLGQGVAWDGWYGRGERTNHPEDYAEYVKGGDVVSFDIYPVTADHPDVKGKLERVGFGTRRLRAWANDGQTVWACIEATHIGNPNVKPTPQQTRALVWQAIINGATGLVYFSHQFAPSFIEAAILADEAMANGIKATNAEVLRYAPILNSPSVPATVAGEASVLAKRRGRRTTIFAISNSPNSTDVTISLPRRKGTETFRAGSKTFTMTNGVLRDTLGPYEMRCYEAAAK